MSDRNLYLCAPHAAPGYCSLKINIDYDTFFPNGVRGCVCVCVNGSFPFHLVRAQASDLTLLPPWAIALLKQIDSEMVWGTTAGRPRRAAHEAPEGEPQDFQWQ